MLSPVSEFLGMNHGYFKLLGMNVVRSRQTVNNDRSSWPRGNREYLRRRLNLHASALNDAEYALYTASLDALTQSHTSNDDAIVLLSTSRPEPGSEGAIHAFLSLTSIPWVYFATPCRLRCSIIILLDLKIISSELRPVRHSDGGTVLRCLQAGYTCWRRGWRGPWPCVCTRFVLLHCMSFIVGSYLHVFIFLLHIIISRLCKC